MDAEDRWWLPESRWEGGQMGEGEKVQPSSCKTNQPWGGAQGTETVGNDGALCLGSS